MTASAMSRCPSSLIHAGMERSSSPPMRSMDTFSSGPRRASYASSGSPPPPVEFPNEFADYHRGAAKYSDNERNAAEAVQIWKELLARPPGERHYRTTWALYMLGKVALGEEEYDAARDWFAKVVASAREGFADSIGLAAAARGWEAEANFQSGHYAEARPLFIDNDQSRLDQYLAQLDAAKKTRRQQARSTPTARSTSPPISHGAQPRCCRTTKSAPHAS